MFGSTFIVSLSVAMVTAFAMYLDLESIGPALYSAITIAHLLAGTVFGLLLLCGVTGHIRNFYSVRRLGLNLSGWLLSVASIVAILSGGWLLGYGSAQTFICWSVVTGETWSAHFASR